MPDGPFNTWEQVGSKGVYITRAYLAGRQASFCGWQVVATSHKTDPEGPWYNYGNKTFSSGGYKPRERGAGALEAAKAWAMERYGIKRWKRNAAGDYIDADANLSPTGPFLTYHQQHERRRCFRPDTL